MFSKLWYTPVEPHQSPYIIVAQSQLNPSSCRHVPTKSRTIRESLHAQTGPLGTYRYIAAPLVTTLLTKSCKYSPRHPSVSNATSYNGAKASILEIGSTSKRFKDKRYQSRKATSKYTLVKYQLLRSPRRFYKQAY